MFHQSVFVLTRSIWLGICRLTSPRIIFFYWQKNVNDAYFNWTWYLNEVKFYSIGSEPYIVKCIFLFLRIQFLAISACTNTNEVINPPQAWSNSNTTLYLITFKLHRRFIYYITKCPFQCCITCMIVLIINYNNMTKLIMYILDKSKKYFFIFHFPWHKYMTF